MLLKYTVVLLVIVAVKSAILKERIIPVEIRYERLEHDFNSNLAEKLQLSSEDLKENQLRLQKLTLDEEDNSVPSKDHSYLLKNLDEKVQLSPEELLQSSKHIPIHHPIQDNSVNKNLEKLGELRTESLSESSQDVSPNKVSLIQQAQDIVEKGLENLRKNFQPKPSEVAPSKELWDNLEKDVKTYFMEQRNKLGSRQDQNQQNIFQNLANGFQEMTNNFLQQFQGQNSQNGTSGDEGTQPQNPIQGFIGYFTGGVQNIVSNIQNAGQNGLPASGNSTVLGDNGDAQQPPNFIGNFVNGVQQFFQAPQQGINQVFSGNNTQGDTGTSNPPGSQQGFFAGAISQFNQVVGNIVSTSQAPPAAQGDEGSGTTASSQGGNPIQQVFQSFGNLGTAFNQFVQGGQPNKPQGSEDENSSPPPNQNFIQSIGQNIGNAFQNIQNQFRPPGGSTQKPAVEGPDGGDSNPIVGQVSNLGSQFQQVAGQVAASNPIQNFIPGSSSESSVKNPAEDEPTTVQSEKLSEKADEDQPKTEEPEKKEVMTATE